MIFAYEPLCGRNAHEAGRQLLARLYRQSVGAQMPDICISPRGKPYFASGTLHFSISHTKKHVFCVLAEHPVGIDAEELDRPIDLRLAEKILSPAEKQQFDTATDRSRALLTFWVLKEAAAKLSGEGLRGYPNHTDFSLRDPRIQTRDGCIFAIFEEETNPIPQGEDHAV